MKYRYKNVIRMFVIWFHFSLLIYMFVCVCETSNIKLRYTISINDDSSWCLIDWINHCGKQQFVNHQQSQQKKTELKSKKEFCMFVEFLLLPFFFVLHYLLMWCILTHYSPSTYKDIYKSFEICAIPEWHSLWNKSYLFGG